MAEAVLRIRLFLAGHVELVAWLRHLGTVSLLVKILRKGSAFLALCTRN